MYYTHMYKSVFRIIEFVQKFNSLFSGADASWFWQTPIHQLFDGSYSGVMQIET